MSSFARGCVGFAAVNSISDATRIVQGFWPVPVSSRVAVLTGLGGIHHLTGARCRLCPRMRDACRSRCISAALSNMLSVGPRIIRGCRSVGMIVRVCRRQCCRRGTLCMSVCARSGCCLGGGHLSGYRRRDKVKGPGRCDCVPLSWPPRHGVLRCLAVGSV